MRISRYEEMLRKEGLELIAGIDEAGRGPLAGPVVAAAVIFPKEVSILGIKDSKKLSPKRRDELFPKIYEMATTVGVGIVGEETIDQINIFRATHLAMKRAVTNLAFPPHGLLIDSMTLPDIQAFQLAIPKGDELSHSIAAASIVAKVTRDRIMVEYDELFPKYGFIRHKGYGTREHMEALERYGPCRIHRRSFRPVREMAKGREKGVR